MVDDILECLVISEDRKTDLPQSGTSSSKDTKCDYCGNRISGVPYRSDALFGDYCDRQCFLIDFNRDNIFP